MLALDQEVTSLQKYLVHADARDEKSFVTLTATSSYPSPPVSPPPPAGKINVSQTCGQDGTTLSASTECTHPGLYVVDENLDEEILFPRNILSVDSSKYQILPERFQQSKLRFGPVLSPPDSPTENRLPSCYTIPSISFSDRSKPSSSETQEQPDLVGKSAYSGLGVHSSKTNPARNEAICSTYNTTLVPQPSPSPQSMSSNEFHSGCSEVEEEEFEVILYPRLPHTAKSSPRPKSLQLCGSNNSYSNLLQPPSESRVSNYLLDPVAKPYDAHSPTHNGELYVNKDAQTVSCNLPRDGARAIMTESIVGLSVNRVLRNLTQTSGHGSCLSPVPRLPRSVPAWAIGIAQNIQHSTSDLTPNSPSESASHPSPATIFPDSFSTSMVTSSFSPVLIHISKPLPSPPPNTPTNLNTVFPIHTTETMYDTTAVQLASRSNNLTFSQHCTPISVIAGEMKSDIDIYTGQRLHDLTGQIARQHEYPSAHGGFADVWKGLWYRPSGTCQVCNNTIVFIRLAVWTKLFRYFR